MEGEEHKEGLRKMNVEEIVDILKGAIQGGSLDWQLKKAIMEVLVELKASGELDRVTTNPG